MLTLAIALEGVLDSIANTSVGPSESALWTIRLGSRYLNERLDLIVEIKHETRLRFRSL